jgi:hypothetical protein
MCHGMYNLGTAHWKSLIDDILLYRICIPFYYII